MKKHISHAEESLKEIHTVCNPRQWGRQPQEVVENIDDSCDKTLHHLPFLYMRLEEIESGSCTTLWESNVFFRAKGNFLHG